MEIKEDIESIKKRIREAFENQEVAQPKICICDCFSRYRNARKVWEQKAEEFEAEIRQLQRTLNRTLNRGFKPRTDAYPLQSQR